LPETQNPELVDLLDYSRYRILQIIELRSREFRRKVAKQLIEIAEGI
jgi:hypothetical protein